MAKKNPFGVLQSAFENAESNLSLTPEGNGGYSVEPASSPSGKPRSLSARPQTPAQHQAVVKAARTSASKRRARAFKPQGL